MIKIAQSTKGEGDKVYYYIILIVYMKGCDLKGNQSG